MNDPNTRDPRLLRKRAAYWRGSIYEEPTWVSLAWILCPLIIAATVIYVGVL